MILIALGALFLLMGLHLFRTRAASREMIEEERRTDTETSLPITALGAAYVFPAIGLFLLIIGLVQML